MAMQDSERARHAQPLRSSDSGPPIDDGSDGWCEETGEPIGLARLEARPVATLCVEAQELRERQTGAGH